MTAQLHKKAGRTKAESAKWIPLALPFLLLLVFYTPLLFLLEKYVRAEILFGLCFIPSWILTRKLGWDENSLLCLLSGYLLSLSGPDINFAPLCFVGLIPLFIALERSDRIASSFFYGMMTAFSTSFVGLSWMKYALADLCGISQFQSYFLALPCFFLINTKFILLALAYHGNKHRFKFPKIFFLPSVFAVLELIKWEPYPWSMGIFMTRIPSLVQIIDITGLPGLSFFILLVNLAIFSLWSWHGKEAPKIPWKNLALTGTIFLALFVYGRIRIHQIQSAEAKAKDFLSIAAIQPNSPLKIQSRDMELKKKICENLEKMAHQSVKQGTPDLIVFAEGSTTVGYQAGYNPEFRDTFNRIARELATPIMFDNIHFVSANEYYRSAVLLSQEGKISGEYLKRKLAPFGEYIPLETFFPRLRRIFKYAKNYKTGTENTLLQVKDVAFVPQICFESIHPGFTRRFVKKGGRIIINITNDKWFGEKEARQHLALSAFRCVENRVPMARITNNGISAYVSASGIPVPPLSPYDATWTDCRRVPLIKTYSFYREYGDVFSWFCLGFIALKLFFIKKSR